MMSVVDRDDANENITLKNGDRLSILLPTVREALLEKFNDSGWTEERFASTLQNELVLEFNRRGINAQGDSSKEGNFLLIHINELEPGSGVARVIGITGIGLAESDLEGIAILSTSEGKRELELKKQGQKSGVTEAGDQTSENIHYFASALASKICIE
jgi:hypothetical protein